MNNNKDETVNFNIQVGLLSSELEYFTPEIMFKSLNNQNEAVSAVKAISIAAKSGQRIYYLTSENQIDALKQINHNSDTMSDIIAALAQGKEVVIHESSIAVNGWQGSGYIVLDPLTGNGAYMISSSTNGGAMSINSSLASVFFVLGNTFSWDCYTQCLENNRWDLFMYVVPFYPLPKKAIPPFRQPYPNQPWTSVWSTFLHYSPLKTKLKKSLRHGGRLVMVPVLLIDGIHDWYLLVDCAYECSGV